MRARCHGSRCLRHDPKPGDRREQRIVWQHGLLWRRIIGFDHLDRHDHLDCNLRRGDGPGVLRSGDVDRYGLIGGGLRRRRVGWGRAARFHSVQGVLEFEVLHRGNDRRLPFQLRPEDVHGHAGTLQHVLWLRAHELSSAVPRLHPIATRRPPRRRSPQRLVGGVGRLRR